MQRTRPIARTLLRDETRHEVLDAILNGRIPAGQIVHEKQLACELGVSRTPLREALLGLEREGYLRRSAAGSLSVAPLCPREATELCTLLGGLEALAIRAHGLPATAVLTELSHKAANFAEAVNGRNLLPLDHEWHDMLLAACMNQQLKTVIDGVRRKLGRYDTAYLRQVGVFPKPACAQKQIVLFACRLGSAEDVAWRLETTWADRSKPLRMWLSNQLADVAPPQILTS